MTDAREEVVCDQCGRTFVLQDVAFHEGPGSAWWCNCPHCNALLDPDALESLGPPIPLHKVIAARVLDDIAWGFYLPMQACTFLGLMPPRWLISATVFAVSPFHRTALTLRGHRWGVGVVDPDR